MPEYTNDDRERLIAILYHAAYDLVYYVRDFCGDRNSRKKRYWLEIGIKVQFLYQAVEEFATCELYSSEKKRGTEQTTSRPRRGLRRTEKQDANEGS